MKFDGEDRSTLASNDLIDHEHFDAVFAFELDPASRNFFLANMFQSQIEVISLETRHRTLIHSGSDSETGVGRPAAITVNHIDSEIYWIDNGYEAVPIKIGILIHHQIILSFSFRPKFKTQVLSGWTDRWLGT